MLQPQTGARPRGKHSSSASAVSKMMNFVSKTRNCVSKTKNFALKMMIFADRWLKPQDALYVGDIMPSVVCPVTRQLLGDSWSNHGTTGPTPADAPLFSWLKENGIDPASTGLEGKQGQGSITTPAGPQNYGRLQGEESEKRCTFD